MAKRVAIFLETASPFCIKSVNLSLSLSLFCDMKRIASNLTFNSFIPSLVLKLLYVSTALNESEYELGDASVADFNVDKILPFERV